MEDLPSLLCIDVKFKNIEKINWSVIKSNLECTNLRKSIRWANENALQVYFILAFIKIDDAAAFSGFIKILLDRNIAIEVLVFS